VEIFEFINCTFKGDAGFKADVEELLQEKELSEGAAFFMAFAESFIHSMAGGESADESKVGGGDIC
jgi:hypothetical protein